MSAPPSTVTSRPFRDLEDLRAMARLNSAGWLANAPLVSYTAGDVEWWYAAADPSTDFTRRVRLWERDGALVAWAWFTPPAEFDRQLHPDLTTDEAAAVLAQLTGWAEDHVAAGIGRQAGDPAPTHLATYGMDASDEERAGLAYLGFAPDADAMLTHNIHVLEGLTAADLPPVPDLPDGYVLRHVRGPEEIDARVAVHRAAFGTEKMTAAKYTRVMAMDHYAFARDLVVEAPDGTLAAFAILWWDPVGRVGELEPVGTHPDHRRRHLGLAICRRALHLLQELGAQHAIVFAEADDPASNGLYQAAGFTPLTLHRKWRRPLPASP